MTWWRCTWIVSGLGSAALAAERRSNLLCIMRDDLHRDLRASGADYARTRT